jgi:hypothetical protein
MNLLSLKRYKISDIHRTHNMSILSVTMNKVLQELRTFIGDFG